MASKIRCVKNISLERTRPDGMVEISSFSYGKYYPAKLIEIIEDDPEYVNIVLECGDRINGVSRNVFENFGVEQKRVLHTHSPELTEEIKVKKNTKKKTHVEEDHPEYDTENLT